MVSYVFSTLGGICPKIILRQHMIQKQVRKFRGRSVFYVSTPLAVVNAQEAIVQLQLDTEATHLIVFDYRDDISNLIISKIKAIIDGELWGNITFHKLPTFAQRITKFFEVWKLGNSLKRVDNLFVTHNGTTMALLLIKAIKYKELILLDDGTATLALENDKNIQRSKSKGEWLLRLQPQDYTLFTIFDINRNNRTKDIIRNTYQNLKCVNRESELENCVVFFGQPLVELGYVSQVDYLRKLKSYVEKVRSDVGAFYYVAHYFENKKNVDRVLNQLGIDERYYEMPPEWVFTKLDVKKPRYIASFASTALFTLPKLLGSAITYESIDIQNEIQRAEIKSVFNNMHEELRSSGLVKVY